MEQFLPYIGAALSVATFLGVFFIAPRAKRIKDLETELLKLRSEMQTGYMSKQDFMIHLTRIESHLTELRTLFTNNRGTKQ